MLLVVLMWVGSCDERGRRGAENFRGCPYLANVSNLRTDHCTGDCYVVREQREVASTEERKEEKRKEEENQQHTTKQGG